MLGADTLQELKGIDEGIQANAREGDRLVEEFFHEEGD